MAAWHVFEFHLRFSIYKYYDNVTIVTLRTRDIEYYFVSFFVFRAIGNSETELKRIPRSDGKSEVKFLTSTSNMITS